MRKETCKSPWIFPELTVIYEEDPTDMYLLSFLCYYGGLLEEQGGI